MGQRDTYLLTASDIDAMPEKEKSHFLNPKATRRERSLGTETGMTEIDFTLITVEPGMESTEHHKHYHEEECCYVLAGQGEARIGAEVHNISAGDFVGFRKGGLAHSLKNTGDISLNCIVVSQRKDHDVSDYPRCGKRLFRNKDLTWNMVDLGVIDRPFGARV
jgi:uncharacterized cupin superfamily protein